MNKGMSRKIDCWFTTRDPFDAPEIGPRIVGTRAGDPPGRQVVTSTVEEIDGRYVKTMSGSVYELGEPDPDFVKFLRENGYPFDPENPIRRVDKITELPLKTAIDRTKS